MAICKIIARGKQKPLIGAYRLDPIMEHLPDLELSLTRLQDHYPIVLGELNANIVQDQNLHSKEVTYLLMKFVMLDLLHHFR